MTQIPYGDPGAMRGLAFALNAKADTIAHIGADVYDGAFALQFEGRAGNAFRSEITEARFVDDAIAERIRALADYLIRQAGILERDQEAARLEIAADLQRQRDELARQKAKATLP